MLCAESNYVSTSRAENSIEDYIGYVITEDTNLANTLYHVRYCYGTAGRSIRLGALINATQHFRTYNAADVYAKHFFLHMRRDRWWIYIGNMNTNVRHLNTLHWHSQHTHIRKYKAGYYYSISKKRRGTPRKLRRANVSFS